MSWYKYESYCLPESDVLEALKPRRYESEEVKVLEALKPHPNLTSLTIIGFRGFRLPDWMNHSVLKRVVSIRIEGCENCSCLPPFGDLPCLESLVLENGSGEVEYVEEDDVSTRRWFPSLRKLSIWDFRNLKGLLKKGGEEQFPVLQEMNTDNCPMFVCPTLSSVRKLEIFGEADATSLNSISNLCALTFLHISSIIKATSLPEEMLKSLANLKYLKISGLCNLKELPSSLASLNALKSLDIESCYALESLPEEGVKGLTSLTELSIFCCEMLKCLPEGLQHLLDTNASNISTDEAALLAFKAHITSDPNGMLSKNWTKGTHVCNWIGISCSRRHQRVTSLDLNGLRLRGSIATEIGNLSFLSFLDIGNNSIHSEIPDELGYLRRLKHLTLSMNNLTGQIPESLGLLRRLELLDLSENDLFGSVPSSIFNVSSLKVINLIYNALSGTLPNDICHNLPQGINPILSHSIWLRDTRSGPGQCDHLHRQYVSSMKVIFCKFPQNTSDLLLVTRVNCDWKAKMTL